MKNKIAHVEICESRKVKGGYYIRLVAKNGERLSHSETLNSVAAIEKNLKAQYAALHCEDADVFNAHDIDRTKAGLFAKKFGIKHEYVPHK